MAMVTGICNGCGATIVWGQIEGNLKTGDKPIRVPLDPKPAVYFIEGQIGGGIGNETEGYRIRRANGNKERAVGQAMVSHFTTCPKAADFSGRGRGR